LPQKPALPGHQRIAQAWLGVLAACLVALAAPAHGDPDSHADASSDNWNIVLIRNWDAAYVINTVREQALREAVERQAPKRVQWFTEHVDALRFGSDYEPQYAAVLKSKYRKMHVDLVIASGLEPLQFATAHRDELWPGVPIVFNGVIDGALDGWRRAPRTTGVSMVFDVPGTLALGRALVPGARELYVVSGASDVDRQVLEIVNRQIDRAGSGLQQKALVGLTRSEVAESVSKLPPHSLVLYLTQLRDARGELSGPGAGGVTEISKRSSAPVISPIYSQYGRGPLGGSSSPIAAHGRIAGELARRILEGADPDAIPLAALPAPLCEVDWNGVQRWKLEESLVPAQCRLLNKPPDMLRTYVWSIFALVAIVLLQAALLWSLALQSRRRRRAEEQLRVRSTEMAQVARLSTIGELTASIAHEINQPMGAILSNTEAAQIMLEQGTLTTEKLREILADIRSEDLRASDVIRSLRKLLSRSEWNLLALEPNTEVAEALRHVTLDAARRDVRLLPTFGADVPAVFADSVQLQQVVINLVMNAMDAVSGEPDSGREVQVATRAIQGGVEICVSDRGPGVPPESETKLFQSMFTTKKDGMGFGLSIIKTIVEMHRGRVRHERNVPRGAIFRVWLPSIGT
jgi:signal transduction histidine kinase